MRKDFTRIEESGKFSQGFGKLVNIEAGFHKDFTRIEETDKFSRGFRKLVNIEEGFCKDFTRFSQGLIKLVYIEGKKYFPLFLFPAVTASSPSFLIYI